MANEEHLAQLKQRVAAWNRWRSAHRDIRPDLSGADLSGADLSGADLSGADLSGARLAGADLARADLRGTDLSRADLRRTQLRGAEFDSTDLRGADLSGADLRRTQLRGVDLSGARLAGADLRGVRLAGATFHSTDLSGVDLRGAHLARAHLARADLRGTHLAGADLSEANLQEASLVGTDFEGANLTGCKIHGVSAWNINLEGARQRDLVITHYDEPVITVDNLAVAQFIYLLLHNEKIREVIDAITSKAVLILGRFTPDRKVVLDAMREELRHRNYLPILFDFKQPTDRDFTETIMTLAGMCLFIIADITNPKSSPLELQATIPNYMVPFVPIIQEGEQPFAMFKDLRGKFDWVLDILAYDSEAHLIRGFEKAVIQPALMKHDELLAKKAEELRIRHIRDYLVDI